MVYGVNGTEVYAYWALISGLVKRITDRNERFEPEDIKQAIESGHRQLWVSEQDGNIWAIAITAIEESPHLKELVISGCAGEGDWSEMIKTIEDFGRQSGCQLVSVYGRPGWERKLPDYKKTRVVLEKTL